ncbi:MAG: type II secretion system protein N [Candidatus Babeliales bacterium]|nr:type II secretion system protein N [Candidatus Babeliales bacterium]
MKQSLWIVNSILFCLFLGVILFIAFSKVKIASRKSIVPEVVSTKGEVITKMDTTAIYKNDLFGTTQPMQIKNQETTELEIAMPAAPQAVRAEVPEVENPNFLEPLPLTLTGIIVVSDESNNQAIIMDNRTNKQKNYKLGDEIEDAQIASIFKEKIILIRSNGQQEVLYLRTADVKQDSPMEQKDWKKIIKKNGENEYDVDYEKFAENVKSIGSFTDLMNLTSAYKDGKNIGVKVGKVETGSLAAELGLQPGDIIQKVDGIEVDNTQNRYEAYSKAICKQDEDFINVEVLRSDKTQTIKYRLSTAKDLIIKSEIKPKEINEENIIKEKMKVLQEKHKFAPSYKEIKSQERSKLFKKMADYKPNDVNK